MKLALQDINVQTTGQSKKSKKMSIRPEDANVMFSILEKKIYKDPIAAIVREISTNAKDSHIEAGKTDVPIEIKVPTDLDNSFYIRDFGTGISEENIWNVFANYCSSTKRNNKSVSGCFGIGSKSPFSYSNTFSITSVTPDESGKLICRQYAAMKKGTENFIEKIIERSASKDERQGLTITIPVKALDHKTFILNVYKYTEYWKVKPNIIPVNSMPPEQNDSKVVYESDTGSISRMDRNWYKPMVVVVGEIPYPYNDKSFYGGDIKYVVNFEPEEIQVTASREDIDASSSETKQNILKKLADLKNEYQKVFEDKISKIDNYIEYKQELVKNRNIVDTYKLVTNKNLMTDTEFYDYLKPLNIYAIKFKYDLSSFSLKKMDSDPKIRQISMIGVSNHTSIIVDDTTGKGVNRKRLHSLLLKHGMKKQYIIIKKDENFVEKDSIKYEYLSDFEESTTLPVSNTRGQARASNKYIIDDNTFRCKVIQNSSLYRDILDIKSENITIDKKDIVYLFNDEYKANLVTIGLLEKMNPNTKFIVVSPIIKKRMKVLATHIDEYVIQQKSKLESIKIIDNNIYVFNLIDYLNKVDFTESEKQSIQNKFSVNNLYNLYRKYKELTGKDINPRLCDKLNKKLNIIIEVMGKSSIRELGDSLKEFAIETINKRIKEQNA